MHVLFIAVVVVQYYNNKKLLLNNPLKTVFFFIDDYLLKYNMYTYEKMQPILGLKIIYNTYRVIIYYRLANYYACISNNKIM